MRLPRFRHDRGVYGSAGLLLLLVVTQVLLPGQGSGHGTPAAILYSGLVFGMLNAVTAVGIVLIYRTTRIINFAQTAFGAAGGQLTFQLVELTHVPFVLALIAGLFVAGLVGFLFDLVIGRRFFRAPRLVLTIATIASAGVLAGLSSRAIQALPFLPKSSSIDQLIGNVNLRPKLPWSDFTYHVGSLRIAYGFPELLALALSLASIAGLAALLRFTKSGVAVRAYSENLERAALLGIGTGQLSTIVWTTAGLLSGVGVILTGLVATPSAAVGTAPSILLPALAAAVLAQMERILVAVVASVVISVASAAVTWSFQQDGALVSLGLFLIVAVGLLLQGNLLGRSESGAGVTWEASKEQRPIPRELVKLPAVRATRGVLLTIGLVTVVTFPLLASTGSTVLGSVITLSGIMALSVLVLTGWGGQASLGQSGIAGVGGVVGGAVMQKVGLPFVLSVPLAVAFAAAVAVLIGLPALRIRGLFLAITTFSFSIAVSAVLFNPRYFGWLLPDTVRRPHLLIDFEDERAMYYLCLSALVLCIFLVSNLRRSRFGRLLIGTRENEPNVQALGISSTRIKLIGFGVSGALAGLSGVLLVTLLRGVPAQSFAPQRSIDIFLIAVLGGVSSVPGVLLGAFYFNVTSYFFSTNVIFSVIQPFAVILLLFIEPTGLIGLINRMRDGALRIVAQRHQLIVPSLFADIDESALERRLVPLAESIPGAGLAALGRRESFALTSRLYARGRRAGPVGSARAGESLVLAAAATASDDALAGQR
jgi:branched-chain amino acid transport system permease protein